MYVDLAGLARYKSDFGAWARGSLLPKDAAAARVRTAKAGAVSLVPVQETPLDVSVDFLFAETPPASGDKSPENPSTISGVSSVKVTHGNKNYVSLPYHTPSRTVYDVEWTVNPDNSVTAVGTATQNSYFYFTGNETTSLRLEPNRKYFLHGCPSGGSTGTFRLGVTCGAGSFYSNAYDYGNGAVFIPKTHDANVIVFAQINSGYSANVAFRAQLEDGETGTAIEVVPRNVYTLPLGNTYYGGSLDLATGIMTVTVAKNTFVNPYNVISELTDNTYICFQRANSAERPHGPNNDDNLSCNMFPTSGTGERLYTRGGTNNTTVALIILKSRLDVSSAVDPSNPTTAEWIAAYNVWATTHTVEYTYTFATPYTVQLSPTEILSLTQSSDYDPRVNTVYADAQAVQVGYLKHPSAASADLRDAVVSLGGGV